MFRVLFGLLVSVGALRFLLHGWIDPFFVQPKFFFKYWGFSWVEPLGSDGMHAVFIALVVLGVTVALGAFYRISIVALFLLFAYVELLDVTHYLNHYYLLSLLAFLLCFLPLHRSFSVDSWRASTTLSVQPAWVLWLLRFQVGVVYFFAGLAKAGTDWLFHAQPLGIWMSARVDTPLLGELLTDPLAPVLMSWGGFLYDTTVVAFLLYARTRPWAFLVLVAFHTAVGYFFNIGMFPFIMVSCALIFFSPSWPRRFVPNVLLSRWPAPESESIPSAEPSGETFEPLPWRSKLAVAAVALYCTFQVVMPLRTHFYTGDVLWHEQGMRWSWRVMVREKNGSVTYRVKLPSRTRERLVYPSRYLTRHQEREMSSQPDMILQLAHRIAQDFRAKGHENVEVRVDALVSLNGRPPQRMIDPHLNLAEISDSLAPALWILPAPDVPPLPLRTREALSRDTPPRNRTSGATGK